ncbi:hypothetical protein B0H17DRAFT_1136127 [Mycena rosella]|uniref:Uncharacterized protein n=1 Tax=Mycena rosella TaxID=1033263 RepID=A0AAD7DBT0_MYCRO|nr:hypothetical protein B0H17DRAFT_1136127 [Mycena rosella]
MFIGNWRATSHLQRRLLHALTTSLAERQLLNQDHASHVRMNELLADRRFLPLPPSRPVCPPEAAISLPLPHLAPSTPEEHQDNARVAVHQAAELVSIFDAYWWGCEQAQLHETASQDSSAFDYEMQERAQIYAAGLGPVARAYRASCRHSFRDVWGGHPPIESCMMATEAPLFHFELRTNNLPLWAAAMLGLGNRWLGGLWLGISSRYKGGVFLSESTIPNTSLMIPAKARRSLKCLPRLPPSPFDRKVMHRGNSCHALKARPVVPRAAAAVLPWHPVPSASAASLCCLTPASPPPLSSGEGFERGWHFAMYIKYPATMSPLLYRLIYAPATQVSTVAISPRRTAELREPFRATLLALHASFMEIRERFTTDLSAATASFNF